MTEQDLYDFIAGMAAGFRVICREHGMEHGVPQSPASQEGVVAGRQLAKDAIVSLLDKMGVAATAHCPSPRR